MKAVRLILQAGLLLLAFTPLVITPSTYFPFIIGKAYFFRIVVLLCLPALFMGTATARSRVITAALGLLLWWCAGADALAGVPVIAFLGTYERMEGFIGLLFLALFTLEMMALFGERGMRLFLGVWCATSAVVAELALQQGMFNPLIARVSSTLGNPAFLATYAAECAFLSCYLAASSKRYWGRSPWLIVALVNIAEIAVTQTRGAALAICAGVGVMAVVRYGRRAVYWVAGAAGAAGAALAVLVSRGTGHYTENGLISRFADMGLHGQEGRARIEALKIALKAIAEHPIFGLGHDQFRAFYLEWGTPGLVPNPFDRVHDLPLDWAVSSGIPGLLLFAGLLGIVARMILTSRASDAQKAALMGFGAAYVTCNLFVFDTLATAIPLYAVIALMSGQTPEYKPRSRSNPGQPSTPRYWWANRQYWRGSWT